MDHLACVEQMMEDSPDVSEELREKKRYQNLLPPEVVSCPKDLTAFVDVTLVQNKRVFPSMLYTEKVSVGYVNNYFRTVQDDISPRMKRDVAIWMFEVCEEDKMNDAVFIRAAQYMDKFLSVQRISKTQLQLLGAVCLLISSKISGTTISSERLVAYTANSITCEMLLEWERLVLQLLQWDMYGIVSADFVQHFLNLIPQQMWDSPKVMERIKTFTAYCAVDHQFGLFLPSVIAAASIATALKPFIKPECLKQVLSSIVSATQIDHKQVMECMEQITAKVLVSASASSQQPAEGGHDNMKPPNTDSDSASSAQNACGCRIKSR